MTSANQDFDVIIIGAGLSGLNTVYLLQTQIPEARFAILESREIIGGTWSFWKYPGARSDSASTVFRFTWFPWPDDTGFADAERVHDYAKAAVKAKGLDRHIHFQRRVGDTRWSSAEQQWTLDVTDVATGASQPYRARWIIHCGGYYSYEKPLSTVIPGLEQFRGEVAHPQFWDESYSFKDKRVVLIGSGATAVTILPHVAKTAAHVTMLQRSPSYVIALPKRDAVTAVLRRYLPVGIADTIDWYRHMVTEHLFVFFLSTFPNVGRRLLRSLTKKSLPADYPVDVHFNPAYTPFDQRLCMAPDGDFFRALSQPNCEIVTDVIDTVTETGIRLKKAGTEIEADMIITATGLHVEILGGNLPVVDGETVDISKRYTWRGCMVEGVPNSALIIGYTTGTWMPGADARGRTVLSVIKQMRKQGATSAWPKIDAAVRSGLPRLPAMPNSSGYLVQARDRLPLSSGRYPWVNGLNWFYDTWYNVFGSAKDGIVYETGDKKNI